MSQREEEAENTTIRCFAYVEKAIRQNVAIGQKYEDWIVSILCWFQYEYLDKIWDWSQTSTA